MSHRWRNLAASCAIALLLLTTLGLGCGGGNGDGGKVVIVVGDITDMTGVAATALVPMLWGIEDTADYINQHDPIPGVTLKVVHYDARYDPSRDIPGLEWCISKGARVISTPLPSTADTLKAQAERSKVPVFTWASSDAMVTPPGWVFCNNPQSGRMIKAHLEWISENDPKFLALGRPARIGAAGWQEPYQIDVTKGLEEYCAANSDKFDFVAGFLTPQGTVSWSGEVATLVDCDYVLLPGTGNGITTFAKQFRQKGGTATFIDLDAVPAYKGLLLDAVGWDWMDGTLTSTVAGWWTDGLSLTDLALEIVYQYRPDEAQEMIDAGIGYMGGITGNVPFFDIIRKAVEQVGAENFDGQAFYDAAITFSKTYEGYREWSFTSTKRNLASHVICYEWSKDAGDLVRVGEWQAVPDS